MPRRWSGSAAVPEPLSAGSLSGLLTHLRANWSPDKRQGLHGVSKSGAEALRRESGLAARRRMPSVAGPLPDFDRRSHDEGTSSDRRARRSVVVVARPATP
jgi:hypothetical protein